MSACRASSTGDSVTMFHSLRNARSISSTCNNSSTCHAPGVVAQGVLAYVPRLGMHPGHPFTEASSHVLLGRRVFLPPCSLFRATHNWAKSVVVIPSFYFCNSIPHGKRSAPSTYRVWSSMLDRNRIEKYPPPQFSTHIYIPQSLSRVSLSARYMTCCGSACTCRCVGNYFFYPRSFLG